MRIAPWMLSCAERAGPRAATLARWARTDAGAPPRVHLDAGEAAGDFGKPSRARRIVAAFAAMLARAAAESAAADWLLLLEDDLDFAPHLRAALAVWPPLRDPRCVLGTLYNPHLPVAGPFPPAPAPALDLPRNAARAEQEQEQEQEQEIGPTWFATPRETFTGAQALLVRPADAARALAAWDTEGAMQSARLARLLTAEGGLICVHRPSLVQHVAADSAWGARLHRAPDFAGG